MKKNFGLLISSLIITVLASACSTTKKDDPQPAAKTEPKPAVVQAPGAKSQAVQLQGSWAGEIVSPPETGTCYLKVVGNTVEYKGVDPQEWYKCTFTLREDTTPHQLIAVITDCHATEYVGKTSHGIYRLDGDTLTLTACEPGTSKVPASFDDDEARRMEFKRQK